MQGPRSRRPESIVRRWNRVFTALSAEPRRQIVDALLDVSPDESIALPEAAANPNVETDIERLRVRLHHQDLPVLTEPGFVQWEDEPLRAYRGRNFEEVGVVLESLYANADALPDRLVAGCLTLEQERTDENPERGLKG